MPGVNAADIGWMTGSRRRRWATVAARFGDQALPIAHALARAEAITVHTTVDAHLRLDTYRDVQRTPQWAAWQVAQRSTRAEQAANWQLRAQTVAHVVADLDTGLAAALRATSGTNARLPVLVHAAEALAGGAWFDGPRAFSQTFFADTKVRDDAPTILLEAGADPATLAAIGLTRSAYLGAGGQLVAHCSPGYEADLAGFPGPVRFRTDPPLRFTAHPSTETLVIVENLQAAEAVCDAYPTLAVLYCNGQPSDVALSLITDTAHHLHVVIAPDADLGGVRIAHRIATHLPPDVHSVTVVDAGGVPHPPDGEPFGPASLHGLAAMTDITTPASALAGACLARGYRVEQEAAIRSAIAAHLAPPP